MIAQIVTSPLLLRIKCFPLCSQKDQKSDIREPKGSVEILTAYSIHPQQHQTPARAPQHLQVRSLSSTNTPILRADSQTSSMGPVYSPLRPANGISAAELLPTTSPLRPPFDSSSRHPVFFTNTLRKAPFPLPLPASGVAVTNPVAQGYVFEAARAEAAKRAANGQTKL